MCFENAECCKMSSFIFSRCGRKLLFLALMNDFNSDQFYIFAVACSHFTISVLINQFVLPTFCLCFTFTGINFQGMLHRVCDVGYIENKCVPIRTRKCRSTNWLINYILWIISTKRIEVLLTLISSQGCRELFFNLNITSKRNVYKCDWGQQLNFSRVHKFIWKFPKSWK